MRAIIFFLPGLLFLNGVATQAENEECQYLPACMNGAPCRRNGSVEYCMCPTGFTGVFCELEFASCEDHGCQNNGSCYSGGGVRTCVCQPGYSGRFCENIDASKQCLKIDDGDMLFLPTCSLKTTLTKLAECINDQLPFLNRSHPEAVTTCYEKVTRAKHCFYLTIESCSGTECESAYRYGGVQLYMNIADQFYDPTSNFSVALHEILCTLPGANGTFPYPDEPFNIGAPVCTSDIIDRLLIIMSDSETNFPFLDAPKICEHLEKLKMDIFNVANESCDWSKILDALPYLRNATMDLKPHYWPNALQLAHLYIKEWFIPQCRQDSGSGECPTITSSTPQCKFGDIWMCHYFSYKKAVSQWTAKFLEWWDGCFSYDERNWDDWAGSMGMNRGDGHGMGGFGMTGGHGKAGFIQMIQANMQCSDWDHDDCTGEMFNTTMGCTICYRAGRPRNPQRMFATWLQGYQQYQLATRLVAKLREECAGTTMGCEDNFSSTMAPPTFPSTGFPDISSTMSYNWGSSATPTSP